jgi:hypothetical protein
MKETTSIDMRKLLNECERKHGQKRLRSSRIKRNEAGAHKYSWKMNENVKRRGKRRRGRRRKLATG